MLNAPAPQTLILRKPDDWHVHLRDGAVLEHILTYTAAQFGRAIVMPNLAPPVISKADAVAYRERIMAALATDAAFTPLMTAYLTDSTDPDDLAQGYADGVLTAAKLYPAHATTNSAKGVTDIAAIRPVLARMEAIGMPLLIHGEVTDPEVDVFDREAVFIDQVLRGIVHDFPALKIVFEHITTAEAVAFVESAGPQVGATITPHHLHFNRNAMFAGGIRPHYYCLPVAKRETHRLALRKAAVSGNPKFFLGTDSAPHSVAVKETACGCAGVFNAPYAIESYAAVFEEEGALDKLEGFASVFGPQFYGLPLNEGKITLMRTENPVPATLPFPNGAIVPFHAGETLHWRLTA
jgi:dihydroorotase